MRSRTTHAAPKGEGSHESVHQARRRALAGGGARFNGRCDDCERSEPGRVYAPNRRRRAVHRRVCRVRSAYAKSAGLAVQQANRALRQRASTTSSSRSSTRTTPRPQRAASMRRELITKGADCILGALTSRLDRHRAGRDRSRPRSADRAEQLEPGPYRPGRQRLLPHDAVGHLAGAHPGAPDQGGEMGAGKTISLAGRNDAFGTGAAPAAEAGARALRDARSRTRFSTTPPLRATTRRPTTSSRKPRRIRHPRLPGELREDRLGAPSHRPLQRASCSSRGWPATIPSFIPTASLEGARGTVAGSVTGTKAGEAFHRLFTTSPGTKDRQTLELNNFDGAMICILAALAANSSRAPTS